MYLLSFYLGFLCDKVKLRLLNLTPNKIKLKSKSTKEHSESQGFWHGHIYFDKKV